MGDLGRATWTHVRPGGQIFPIVFPGLAAATLRSELDLREPHVRTVVPVRRAIGLVLEDPR